MSEPTAPQAVAGSPGLLPCWSCKGPVSERALFCSVCGAVQGPGQLDHFTRLGLPASYEIADETLERQYFGFQRRLHPDRFATRSAKEKALSQQQATALNEAYETLKDPLRRAVYMLRRAGRDVDVGGNSTISDPQILMESMELREQLGEAGDAATVEALLADAEVQVQAFEIGLADAFDSGDLDEASRLTIRLKYFSKLAEEARAKRVRLR